MFQVTSDERLDRLLPPDSRRRQAGGEVSRGKLGD